VRKCSFCVAWGFRPLQQKHKYSAQRRHRSRTRRAWFRGPSLGLLHTTHECMSSLESSELHRMPSSRCGSAVFVSHGAFGHCSKSTNIPHKDAIGIVRYERGSEAPSWDSSTQLMNACHTLNQASSTGCHRLSAEVQRLCRMWFSATAAESRQFRTTTA